MCVCVRLCVCVSVHVCVSCMRGWVGLSVYVCVGRCTCVCICDSFSNIKKIIGSEGGFVLEELMHHNATFSHSRCSLT